MVDKNEFEREFERSNCELDRGDPVGVVVVERFSNQKANSPSRKLQVGDGPLLICR